jgi:hypothetical protein
MESAPNFIEKPTITIFTTLTTLQKLFRTLYYPRPILLSMPLLAIIETFHKFTITYPTTIITLHQDTVITAGRGTVITTPLRNTPYTPITLWSGPLAVKISACQIWHPTHPLASATTALIADQNKK